MAKKPSQPSVVAVPTRADLSRALALFAERVADQPDVLTNARATEMNPPLLGMVDLYITGSGEDRVLAFAGVEKPGAALTAGECSAVAAFFARMGALLEEPK